MPHLTFPFSSTGAVMDLWVSVSKPRRDAIVALNEPVPTPVAVKAMIDTGASCTCIDPHIANELQLHPTGTTVINTPSSGPGGHVVRTYDVGILLYHIKEKYILERAIPVVESNQLHNGYSVLLGTDILADCLLVYDGRAKSFAIAF